MDYDHSRPDTKLRLDEVCRAVWDILFEPAPAVQKVIEQNLRGLDLLPGMFVAALCTMTTGLTKWKWSTTQ